MVDEAVTPIRLVFKDNRFLHLHCLPFIHNCFVNLPIWDASAVYTPQLACIQPMGLFQSWIRHHAASTLFASAIFVTYVLLPPTHPHKHTHLLLQMLHFNACLIHYVLQLIILCLQSFNLETYTQGGCLQSSIPLKICTVPIRQRGITSGLSIGLPSPQPHLHY